MLGTNKLHAEVKLQFNFISSLVFNTVQILILHDEQSKSLTNGSGIINRFSVVVYGPREPQEKYSYG